ncbi:MAG TPA: hypothetical protein K8V84_09315 [Nocardiopsis listeri]|uniref:hypothetical protein n=1 Tax=Nocardiopsis listeri TaxID=53440 RepID=UPI001DFC80B6|nr:hypothetical protein [Nocardiopsis listeri]HJE58695.1 hypothetical protein [Nocardiopsis listeri]
METKGSLYLRYAYNDLTGNKGVHLALLVVLTLSAFLMATGAMLMERMLGSVDELFEQAGPPHFLQTHVGDIDTDALERFAAEHPEIEAWQVVGFDGAALPGERSPTGGSGDLSDSLIDQLFTTQNEEFDLLLDETGAAPHPSPGETYVPVAHRTAFDLRVGDVLRIATDSGSLELRVAGFVRDAQMASSLSSATRFVVSEADFGSLEGAGGGAPESIVEYRLDDAGSAADLQRSYEADEALPKNGQAVTHQMIRLVNAFGDGLVAVALVFVGPLLTDAHRSGTTLVMVTHDPGRAARADRVAARPGVLSRSCAPCSHMSGDGDNLVESCLGKAKLNAIQRGPIDPRSAHSPRHDRRRRPVHRPARRLWWRRHRLLRFLRPDRRGIPRHRRDPVR